MSTNSRDDRRGRTVWISTDAINILNRISVEEKRQKSDIVDEAIIKQFPQYYTKSDKK